MASAADVLQSSDRRESARPTDAWRSRSRSAATTPRSPRSRGGTSSPCTMEPTDRLLDALHEVKWRQDGTLALRRSCAHGICGSDAMLINGRNALACKVLVQDVAPKATVEPIRGLPVLKDLIVDMDPFFEGYRSVLPFLVNDERRARQGAPPVPRGARAVRRHDQVHPVRGVHDVVPDLLGRRRVRGARGHRERPPLHLRLARPRRPRAPEDPVGEDRRVPLPDHVQLHRGLPARHPGHEGDPRGQALHPVRPLLTRRRAAYLLVRGALATTRHSSRRSTTSTATRSGTGTRRGRFHRVSFHIHGCI